MEYNKLVRDKISEIIKNKGKSPVTHIADDDEYWEKLKEKLQEETSEFLESNNQEELADILEIIDHICEFKDIDKEKLKEIKEKKAQERGKFKEKIILERVD